MPVKLYFEHTAGGLDGMGILTVALADAIHSVLQRRAEQIQTGWASVAISPSDGLANLPTAARELGEI